MSRSTNRRNGRTLVVLLSIVGGMVGLAYASVPLYQLFCQITGYGGTTQVATTDEIQISDKTITIRFDSNTNSKLDWRFKPEVREMTVRIGEQNLAAYQAKNLSTETTTGTATYNVAPFKAGPYFSKVDCFCFTEQALKPGQQVDMPVSFFVDPEILTDPNTKDLKTITLSYTFYPAPNAGKKAEPSAALATQGDG